jgi:hypothetical protein
MSMAKDFIRPKDPNYSEDEDFARFDRDPNYMPTIPERYKRDAVLAKCIRYIYSGSELDLNGYFSR